MGKDGFTEISKNILRPINATDQQFLTIAEGSLITGAKLPSGALVPSASQNYDWVIRNGNIVLEKKK